jgi:hypothetical protein
MTELEFWEGWLVLPSTQAVPPSRNDLLHRWMELLIRLVIVTLLVGLLVVTPNIVGDPCFFQVCA